MILKGWYIYMCIYIYIYACNPLWWAILGFKMSWNRGNMKNQREADKETEVNKMTGHENHPPFRWVSTWGNFCCKTVL